MLRKQKIQQGFTLIELLVVIAIIGLLASVVLVNVSTARGKAKDVRKIADMKNISTALTLYYQDTGTYPKNLTCAGYVYCTDSSTLGPGTLASCSNHTSIAYDTTFQPVIAAGYLNSPPRAATGQPYCYYNYGPADPKQAVLAVSLDGMTPSTAGIPPSVRWSLPGNWCDSSTPNQYYCLQLSY